MKRVLLAVLAGCRLHCGSGAAAPVNITQFHNHLSRDGLYIDAAFTRAAAGALQRALDFDGRIAGNVQAQPLYIESNFGGPPMVIVATEANNVYALNADDGTIIWQDYVGTAASTNIQPCGAFNPLGITGTPVVDVASRSLFLDAVVSPNGVDQQHLVYSLNVDTGTTNSGWPVDADGTQFSGSTIFGSTAQNQHGALAVLDGTVYVPYGGHNGDCGTYFGWLLGIPLSNPATLSAWATGARGGGSWAVGGVASDGTGVFIATGNTFGATSWSGGEAIIHFQSGPLFSGSSADYWAPTNWMTLDSQDADLGSSGPLLVDVPGAAPSALVVALGKDGNAYLLNRTNLGGVSVPVAQSHVVSGLINPIIQAAATYKTARGTYVAFCTAHVQRRLTAFLITATSPPTITNIWTVSGAWGSPFVTSSDGTNDVVVWGIGAGSSSQRLYGYDGDTGAVVFSGGGTNEVMMGTERLSTAIAARGRIYIANDNRVYALTVPVSPIVLTDLAVSATSGFQFDFTNVPGLSFTVFNTTNLSKPFANWTRLGSAAEIAPGQYEFANGPLLGPQSFYRVRAP